MCFLGPDVVDYTCLLDEFLIIFHKSFTFSSLDSMGYQLQKEMCSTSDAGLSVFLCSFVDICYIFLEGYQMHKTYNYVMFFISLMFFVLKSNGDIITPSFFLPVFIWNVSQSLMRKTENTLNI